MTVEVQPPRETGTAAAPDQSDGRTSELLPSIQQIGVTSSEAIVTDPADGHGDDLVTDKFLPVPGFEGLYEVSCDGHIRSVDRTVVDRNGRALQLRGVELVVSEGGVSLSRDGHRRSYTVSALVRLAFWAEAAR